jgi:5'-3' exonuclease
MSSRKRLMLIDGHALAYRAYHAIPPLTNDVGEPTNATFGYINMLMKAIGDYDPDYVVATFDAGKTFRHEEFDEYKANRAATPDDMRCRWGASTNSRRTWASPSMKARLRGRRSVGHPGATGLTPGAGDHHRHRR